MTRTYKGALLMTEIAFLYRAMHPAYKLLLRRLTIPWTFQVVMLLNAVFGPLMISAFFFGTTASPNVPRCEGPDGLLEHLVRDICVALLSTVVGFVPARILGQRRYRMMPRDSTEVEVRRQLRKWFLKDFACIACGLLWFAFCCLYIMLFLANVSATDADHWLISLATQFACTWLLLPLVATILLITIVRVFASVRGGSFIEDSIGGLLKAVNGDGGARAPEPQEESCQVLELNPVVPAAASSPALDRRPLRVSPGAATDSDDDPDEEDSVVTLVFGMPFEQCGHDEFCGAIKDGLLGMGVGAASLGALQIGRRRGPAGGTIARLRGPVLAIAKVGTMDLTERLEVAGWKPFDVQLPGRSTSDANELERVLDEAQQVLVEEIDSRARSPRWWMSRFKRVPDEAEDVLEEIGPTLTPAYHCSHPPPFAPPVPPSSFLLASALPFDANELERSPDPQKGV